MKIGTLMDPNESRRGNRSRGYIFNPDTMAVDPIDGEDEEEELHGTLVNPDEPEPDDPEAA